jgi:hypothetical protein
MPVGFGRESVYFSNKKSCMHLILTSAQKIRSKMLDFIKPFVSNTCVFGTIIEEQIGKNA